MDVEVGVELDKLGILDVDVGVELEKLGILDVDVGVGVLIHSHIRHPVYIGCE